MHVLSLLMIYWLPDMLTPNRYGSIGGPLMDALSIDLDSRTILGKPYKRASILLSQDNHRAISIKVIQIIDHTAEPHEGAHGTEHNVAHDTAHGTEHNVVHDVSNDHQSTFGLGRLSIRININQYSHAFSDVLALFKLLLVDMSWMHYDELVVKLYRLASYPRQHHNMWPQEMNEAIDAQQTTTANMPRDSYHNHLELDLDDLDELVKEFIEQAQDQQASFASVHTFSMQGSSTSILVIGPTHGIGADSHLTSILVLSPLLAKCGLRRVLMDENDSDYHGMDLVILGLMVRAIGQVLQSLCVLQLACQRRPELLARTTSGAPPDFGTMVKVKSHLVSTASTASHWDHCSRVALTCTD